MTRVPRVPTLDIEALVEGGCDSAEAAAQIGRLGSACRDVGFFAVRGHGVPARLLERTLAHARSFFALPDAAKLSVAPRRWNPTSPNVYRGYFPCSADGKEGFDIGEPCLDGALPELAKRPYYETNRLPGQLGAEWRDEIAAYYEALLRLGRALIEALARSLGGSLGARIACFERPISLSTLRFNYYSSKAGPAATDAHDGAALSCEAHVDSGLLTLLYQDGQGGLQVQAAEGGWVDVPPDPSLLVVNTGLAFETLSSGRFRATRHRVLHSEGARISIPFFLEPSHDFVLSPHSLGLPDEPPARPLVYEEFLTRALARFPEYDRGE